MRLMLWAFFWAWQIAFLQPCLHSTPIVIGIVFLGETRSRLIMCIFIRRGFRGSLSLSLSLSLCLSLSLLILRSSVRDTVIFLRLPKHACQGLGYGANSSLLVMRQIWRTSACPHEDRGKKDWSACRVSRILQGQVRAAHVCPVVWNNVTAVWCGAIINTTCGYGASGGPIT